MTKVLTSAIGPPSPGTHCEVLDRLAEHARVRPDAEAFVESGPDVAGRAIDYRALAERVGILGAAVAGAVPGAAVLLSCPNRVEFPIAYFGVLAAGGVIVPVHPRLTGTELVAIARQVSAGAVIAPDETLRALSGEGLATIRLDDLLGPGAVRVALPEGARPVPLLKGPTLLLQSSGTTGLPKMAIRSGGALGWVARAAADAQRLSPDDRVLAVIPLCHSYGMEAGVLAPVLAGCSVRLVEGFDAPGVLREVRSGATVLPGVPSMFEALSFHLADGLGTGSLRLAFSAGAPMPTAVEAGFRARTGLRIGQLYGATELGWVAFGDPERTGFDPSGVGHPLPGVSVLILDPDDPDPERPLGAGVEGQVAVAAPSMLSGYLGSPTPLSGGYFLTGDLGRSDASGLSLTGRLSMHIEVGGLKVNASEVEQVLLQHPGVGECVVVPLRLSESVRRIGAVLTPAAGVPAGSLSPDELRRFARARLAPHKVPRVFDIRDSLPRSPSGKVLRHELGAL